MNIATRMSCLKPSATVSLNEKVAQLRKEGKSIVNLVIGEPDYPTPSVIVDECIKALREGKTKYGASGGGTVLKSAIIDKLSSENNLNYCLDELVVGVGGKEILFHTMLTILNPGDEVVIFTPYWLSYRTHVELCGAKLIEIPLDFKDGDVVLDIDKISSYFSSKTKCIILNSPNNPGGYVFSQNNLKTLASFLSSKDIWIISDEIYEYFCFDKKHYSILNEAPELQDKTILVNGLSKSFSMTGWRVGYAAGPRQVISRVKSLQSQSSTCIPGFIEQAATEALYQGKKLMEKELQTMKQRRDYIVQELSSIDHLGFIKPQGAFYMFLDVSYWYNSKIKDSLSFCEYLLSECGVAVVPGVVFGKDEYVRLSYAASMEDLKEAVRRLKQVLV